MTYFFALVAGLVQGLTEFLPISSSGHLLILHDLLHFNLPDDLAFDAILHLGTLAALLIFFASDIIKLLKAFGRSLIRPDRQDQSQRLAWLIIIGLLPAALVGYFWEDFIETALRSLWVVAIAFIAMAFAFWLGEKFTKKQNDLMALKWPGALAIGLAQVLAFIPGVSRSGITIIAGLGLNLKRESAARFSFLLSLPLVAAAGLKKFTEVTAWSGADSLALILGFAAAAAVGYWTVNFLLKFFQHHSLNGFAWYRLIIGCLVLIGLLCGWGR